MAVKEGCAINSLGVGCRRTDLVMVPSGDGPESLGVPDVFDNNVAIDYFKLACMPEFIIRDAMTADAAAICAAEKAVVCAHDGLLVFEPDELEESGFAERIASISDGRGKYLVVVRGSELLAHACLWPMGLRKVAHVLRLEMCVHLGHWHQGYGRLLLASLLTWARANPSALKVELLVRSTNVAAISLYRQFGFVEEGRLQGRIRLRNGQLLDDLSMALHIDRNVLTFEEFVAEPNNA